MSVFSGIEAFRKSPYLLVVFSSINLSAIFLSLFLAHRWNVCGIPCCQCAKSHKTFAKLFAQFATHRTGTKQSEGSDEWLVEFGLSPSREDPTFQLPTQPKVSPIGKSNLHGISRQTYIPENTLQYTRLYGLQNCILNQTKRDTKRPSINEGHLLISPFLYKNIHR